MVNLHSKFYGKIQIFTITTITNLWHRENLFRFGATESKLKKSGPLIIDYVQLTTFLYISLPVKHILRIRGSCIGDIESQFSLAEVYGDKHLVSGMSFI